MTSPLAPNRRRTADRHTALVRDHRYIEPEARIPIWVLRTPEMAALVAASPLALHVYLLLSSYASPEGIAWCSQRRLSRLTGAHRRSITDVLGQLRDAGWLAREGKHKAITGDVDLYRLTLPERLEAVRTRINERLRGQSSGEIPYLRDDDVWLGTTQLYQRMARVPRSVLGSAEWGRLRARSGQAMHLYLLLACYAPNAERVSGRRLAEESHLIREYDSGTSLVRLRQALKLLDDSNDRWIEIRRHTLSNGGDGPSHYALIDRLLTANVSPDEELEPLDDGIDPGDAPPYDLIAQLPGPARQAIAEGDVPIPDQWRVLRTHGLWPRRETRDQAALRMIREFQGAMTQQDCSNYEPTSSEWDFARLLFRAFGPRVWEVASAALRLVRDRRWEPGSFVALRTFVPQAAQRLGVEPRIAV